MPAFFGWKDPSDPHAPHPGLLQFRCDSNTYYGVCHLHEDMLLVVLGFQRALEFYEEQENCTLIEANHASDEVSTCIYHKFNSDAKTRAANGRYSRNEVISTMISKAADLHEEISANLVEQQERVQGPLFFLFFFFVLLTLRSSAHSRNGSVYYQLRYDLY